MNLENIDKKINIYSTALYKIVAEKEEFLAYVDYAKNFLKILKINNNQLFIFLNLKNISKKNKKEVVENILKKDDFSILFIDFLKVIIDNDIIYLLKKILSNFLTKIDEKNNVKFVTVYSVDSLSEQQMSKMVEVLERKFNSKIVLANKIDRTLIAGIRVVFGDITYDNSIKSKLNLSIKKIGKEFRK